MSDGITDAERSSERAVKEDLEKLKNSPLGKYYEAVTLTFELDVLDVLMQREENQATRRLCRWISGT